jgi:hypothetical protein
VSPDPKYSPEAPHIVDRNCQQASKWHSRKGSPASMKIGRLIGGLAFALSTPLLLHSQTQHQGRVLSPFSESRILSDIQFGNYTTFGFGATAIGWGLDAEIPFGPSLSAGGRRFEYQPSFAVSIGPKISYRNGSLESQQNLEVNNQGLIWILHRVAAAGGYEYADYWAEGTQIGQTPPFQNRTYTIHRSGWVPNLGGAIRDTLLSRPGRFYANYIFPTRCALAVPSSTCILQAPRTQGVEMMQELRGTTYLRVGAEIAILRYDDPLNPNAPATPRIGHTAVYGTIHLKFEWPASPLNNGGIY